MAKTITVPGPDEKTIEWFVKHVGPRTHYFPGSIGGKGWRFVRYTSEQKHNWTLTVDDEKMLVFYLLVM